MWLVQKSLKMYREVLLYHCSMHLPRRVRAVRGGEARRRFCSMPTKRNKEIMRARKPAHTCLCVRKLLYTYIPRRLEMLFSSKVPTAVVVGSAHNESWARSVHRRMACPLLHPINTTHLLGVPPRLLYELRTDLFISIFAYFCESTSRRVCFHFSSSLLSGLLPSCPPPYR